MKWALIVWLSGFGIMNVLWIFYLITDSVDRSLPGLYDYYAATIGDAICLPSMMLAGLSALKGKILKGKKYQLCLCITAIATLIAVGVQLSWIADANIVLNWTIPEAHHFNLAGWYHAVFFAGMVGITAFLVTAIWLLRSEIIKETPKQNLWFYLFWCSVTLFGYMHAMDDYVDKYGFLPTFLSIFLIGLLIQLGYQWDFSQKKYRFFLSLGGSLVALMVAVTITILI